MTIEEILDFLMFDIPEEYDTSVGSFYYDLLFPVAEQIYLLQNKIDTLSTNTFALTATGEYLDRKVAEQGITRKSATYASGTIRLTGTKGSIVHSGAKVASENILFSIDTTVTIPDIGYTDVTATCTTAGAVGNIGKGRINRYPLTLPGMTAVENITAFTGGYEEESDEDLLERYMEKVSRPNVSGNKYHYIQWAKESDSGVGDVQVIPLWNGPGTVKVVIVDSNNQPATSELITKVQSYIDENKPIGASVTVVSASALKINISVKVESASEVKSDIEKAISDYLANTALSNMYISYAKVGAIIMSVDGVNDYSDLKINNGITNITIANGVVPVLGTVSVT